MDQRDSPLLLPVFPRQTRVIVADPYPVIVQGVRKIVEGDPQFQVVAEASTMHSFRREIVAQRPDVALVDWSMASHDLVGTTALLQSVAHTPSIIFLSDCENSQQKREMLRLGARGFLSKWSSTRKLQRAVREASNARPRRDGPMGEAGLTHSQTAASSRDAEALSIEQLTYRERQLLPLVCGGLKNKEIADQLGIAESTVWHHLTAIFTKLQVEDRLGLAAFLYRHQLLPPDDRVYSSNVAGQTVEGFERSHSEKQRRKGLKPRPASPSELRWTNIERREHFSTGA